MPPSWPAVVDLSTPGHPLVEEGRSPLTRPGPDPGRSEAAEHRRHDAEDRGVVTRDRVVGVVVGEQPHVAVLALERLDGRLALDHRRDDLAVLGGLLLADDDVVAVA